MKFDLVVGNPPYQNNNSDASSGKLWVKFVNKSLDLLEKDGHLSLIVPNSWTKGKIAPSGSGKLLTRLASGKLISVNNIDCGSYFTVGVLFSYFVYQNSNERYDTELTQNGQTISLNFREVFTLPKDIRSLSITNKIFGKYPIIEHKLITNTRNKFIGVEDQGKYQLVTNGKIKFTNNDEYDRDEKIIIPWANSLDKIVVGNYVAGDSNLVFYTNGKSTELWSILTSKLFKFLNNSVKMAHHNEGYRNMPIVPLDKTWTDSELYHYFNLTVEEIELVENS